jgi:hypothetical protein
MIANRLSMKPNFINYSYREEMVSDGIENCICYIDNFDPDKSSNPFAYFTQIIYFAFLRRIQKEKKQLYIKHKTIENSLIMNTLVEQGEFEDGDFVPVYVDVNNESISDFIKNFEEGLEKKKVKRKKGLEKLFDDDGNIILPGFNTNYVTGRWQLDNSKLIVDSINEFKNLFEGSFAIEFINDQLILTSDNSILYCHKEKS